HRVLAALYLQRDAVALILAAELVQDLGVVIHLLAVDLLDDVAGLQLDALGGRAGADGGDDRLVGIDFAAGHGASEPGLPDILSLLEARPAAGDVPPPASH